MLFLVEVNAQLRCSIKKLTLLIVLQSLLEYAQTL